MHLSSVGTFLLTGMFRWVLLFDMLCATITGCAAAWHKTTTHSLDVFLLLPLPSLSLCLCIENFVQIWQAFDNITVIPLLSASGALCISVFLFVSRSLSLSEASIDIRGAIFLFSSVLRDLYWKVTASLPASLNSRGRPYCLCCLAFHILVMLNKASSACWRLLWPISLNTPVPPGFSYVENRVRKLTIWFFLVLQSWLKIHLELLSEQQVLKLKPGSRPRPIS